jgi:hypothetical protein
VLEHVQVRRMEVVEPIFGQIHEDPPPHGLERLAQERPDERTT